MQKELHESKANERQQKPIANGNHKPTSPVIERRANREVRNKNNNEGCECNKRAAPK
jgi:hypothetical protein